MFMDYLEPVCRNACLLFATAVVKVLSLSLPSSPSVSPSHRHTLTPLVPKAASRCAKCSSATSHSCLSRAAPEVTTTSPPISTPFFQRHHLKMMTTSHLRPSSVNPEPFPPLLRGEASFHPYPGNPLLQSLVLLLPPPPILRRLVPLQVEPVENTVASVSGPAVVRLPISAITAISLRWYSFFIAQTPPPCHESKSSASIPS